MQSQSPFVQIASKFSPLVPGLLQSLRSNNNVRYLIELRVAVVIVVVDSCTSFNSRKNPTIVTRRVLFDG